MRRGSAGSSVARHHGPSDFVAWPWHFRRAGRRAGIAEIPKVSSQENTPARGVTAATPFPRRAVVQYCVPGQLSCSVHRHCTVATMPALHSTAVRSRLGCCRSPARRGLCVAHPRAFAQHVSSFPAADVANNSTAVYATLTAAIVSFGLTFGVAPRYKSLFKEADTWRDIYSEIMATGGVASVTPMQAVARARKGCERAETAGLSDRPPYAHTWMNLWGP
jgi:hypothetical protein